MSVVVVALIGVSGGIIQRTTDFERSSKLNCTTLCHYSWVQVLDPKVLSITFSETRRVVAQRTHNIARVSTIFGQCDTLPGAQVSTSKMAHPINSRQY